MIVTEPSLRTPARVPPSISSSSRSILIVRVGVLLRDDLVGEVPRQQQQIVRLLVEKHFDPTDGKAAPGHQLALLVGTPVDHIGDQARIDAAAVQQRRSLGRCSIRRDGPTLIAKPVQQLPKSELTLPNSACEASVVVDSDESIPLFGVEEGRAPAGALGAFADVPPQRSPVQARKVLDIVEVEAVS
jgi:hypothetical protein